MFSKDLADPYDDSGVDQEICNEKLKQDDVLDVFLKASEENPYEINGSHIKSMFLDLFVGGTGTTSNTVEWAMSEVLRKPYIMTKVKEELEKVIGEGKVVEEKDLPKLPYLKCIVKETLRIHPPFPFLIPRKVDKQVKLNGYTVPKGTQVLINVWAIGRDPNIWEDSLDFKPERFMNSGIDVQGQYFELIPFGAGRRICSGLPLAMRMIPMMLGSLLNMFDWNIDDESSEDLDMTERFGISLQKATPLRVVPMPLFWTELFKMLQVGLHISNAYHPHTDGQNEVVNRQGIDTAYLLLYVDDIVLTASSDGLLQLIISSLHQEFAMTDLGPLNYFLGISVTRDSSGLFLSQKKYAIDILEKAHMVSCNPRRTPVDTESKLGVDGDP
ncbi:7-ethoxycoumarin O-deethylase-like protein, partial [Tanacetum coccineum]